MTVNYLKKDKLVHIISLGCAKNLVDTEIMLGVLQQNDYQFVDDIEDARFVIINTCGFLTSAMDESLQEVVKALRLKKKKTCQAVVVTGCLVQRYPDILQKGYPEVDAFLGVDQFYNVANIFNYIFENSPTSLSTVKQDEHKPLFPIFQRVQIGRTTVMYDEKTPRVSATGPYMRYVKIAEGCNHRCSFCVIPLIRGRLKSRDEISIINECQQFLAAGVKELVLIAQDLSVYGKDRDDQANLASLIQKLDHLEGDFWIRLMYMYPENITDEFIDLLTHSKHIVPYLDIPIQHVSNKILTAMKRTVNKEQIEQICIKLKTKWPQMAIRTSIIVGFPGEDEKDFAELKEFISKGYIDHLGCFLYSDEDGATSSKLKNKVKQEVKEQRHQEIMQLQQLNVETSLSKLVGTTQRVLLEGLHPETDLLLQARLTTQAPEVDGVVIINEGQGILGEFQTVTITKVAGYDLIGEIST